MSSTVFGYTMAVSKLLFPRLKQEIEKLRKDGNMKGKLSNSKIPDIIQEELNLSVAVTYDDSGHTNAYVMQPLLNEDHPFLKNYRSAMASGDAIALIKKAKGSIYGGFDNAGKAFGVFADMHTTMGITRGLLENEKFTPGNVAAVICHELGHYRTSLSAVKYAFTTAFLLKTSTDALIATQDRTERTKLVLELENQIGSTIQSKEKVIDSNDKELVTTVVVAAASDVQSELNTNAYDVSSCEQAADQFAVACGAQADLVDALNKIMWYWTPSRIPRPLYYLYEIYNAVWHLALLANPIIAALFVVRFVLNGNPMARTYNKSEERLSRIRQATVAETKAAWLTKDQRKQLTASINTMDEIIKLHKDRPSFYEFFFSALVPVGVRDKRNTDYVRLYEKLITNEVHVGVNKLKSLG